jgi:hypothetical protein
MEIDMTTKNPNTVKTEVLQRKVTQLAGSRGKEQDSLYTKMVKVLARRLNSNPKKVRRQARTGFFHRAC